MKIVETESHNQLVIAAYLARGFNQEEAKDAAKMSEMATTHGNQTHNALKALHLDDLFGSKKGGCLPNAEVTQLPTRFSASEKWDANKKLGQSVACAAFERAIELADQCGVGLVSVDNAFHYLWGGGYVIEAARKGYIAYTNCTSTLAEVVPWMGQRPTLGTNPHSWGFPTTEALGFPICIDWATSAIAMGRVQQLAREGKGIPPNSAIDKDGNPTVDASQVAALLPFGSHKGYGLGLINELIGAFIGSSLPTLRGRNTEIVDEKTSSAFFFQIIHPEAISCDSFGVGRNQKENLKAVLDDIMDGNPDAIFPGELEERAAKRTKECGGLLFTAAEVEEFNQIAEGLNHSPLKIIGDFTS